VQERDVACRLRPHANLAVHEQEGPRDDTLAWARQRHLLAA
jgi:hypothetical protein